MGCGHLLRASMAFSRPSHSSPMPIGDNPAKGIEEATNKAGGQVRPAPTNSKSKAGVREGINKAYRDAALMGDKAVGEEVGPLLPQLQNHSNAG